MPIKQSSIKDLRQNARRAAHNAKVKSDVAALVRHVRKAIAGKNVADATKWLPQAIKKLDRAVQKRVMKKNTVARVKSRLAKAVRAITAK